MYKYEYILIGCMGGGTTGEVQLGDLVPEASVDSFAQCGTNCGHCGTAVESMPPRFWNCETVMTS